MDGNGSGNGASEEEDSEETFHIYVISFVYSLLAVVIVGHFVGRWGWRRRKLRRFKSHVPGDASFKCKSMQQTLTEDFATIKSVSPDPRLVVVSGHDPKEFGGCEGGSDVPTHWYRMKAVDAAAELVSQNVCVLRGELRPRTTLPLPDFLTRLQQHSIGVKGHQSVVEQCMELYNLARYKDGNFSQGQFVQFNSLLQQIKELLSPEAGCGPHSSPHFTLPPSQDRRVTLLSEHEPVSVRLSQTSQDPLLSPSVGSGHGHLPPMAPPHSSQTSSSKSRKKPQDIELSPLVLEEEDVASPTGGSYPASGLRRDPRSPVFRTEMGVAIGQSRFSSPETPV